MRRYSTNRDLNRLARDCIERGWSIEVTNGSHLRWLPPWGGDTIITSRTPSDHRALANTRAMIRRVERKHVARKGA